MSKVIGVYDKRKEKKNEKEKAKSNGAIIASHKLPSSQRASAATDVLIAGDKTMKDLIERRKNCTCQSIAGYAAEVHHKTTFEADAELKGKSTLKVKIGPRGGNGSKGTADLTVTKNGTKVAEAGLKYRAKTSETTFDQSNVFDKGRQKICPSDQTDRVKHLAGKRAKTGTFKSADYADTEKNATDKLRYDGVESKPLSKKSAEKLAQEGSNYYKEAFKTEMKINTINAAKTGAAVGAFTSAISNGVDCLNGQKSVKEACKQVAKDTIKCSVRSVTVSAVTTGTKHALIKASAKNIAKGNLPMAIASTALDAGSEIYSDIKKCCNGELSKSKVATNAVMHTSKAAVKTSGAIAGAELGASIGVFGGPVGVAVGGFIGGTVGYVASSGFVSEISSWF